MLIIALSKFNGSTEVITSLMMCIVNEHGS